MTVRLVVGVLLVTVISMTLQVPEVALSAYMVFFVTKENRALTMLVGVLLILGATVAIAMSLFLFRYTLDFPALRVVTIAAVIFAGMFLSRAFAIGPLGFAIGFVAAMAQNVVDGVHDAETAVRGLLWIWLVVVYPIALTVVLNQIFLPVDPKAALLRALTRRMDVVISALARILEADRTVGKVDASLLDLGTRGSASLFKLLELAEKGGAGKGYKSAQTAAIVSSERLVTAAAALEARESGSLTEDDRSCAKVLIHEIAGLRAALQRSHLVLPPDSPACAVSASPELRELQLASESLRESIARPKALETPQTAAPVKVKKRLFVADAFTNPAHTRFALKVTLAAMSCYVIYSGLDWSGIHTSFITCCFIALENTGASMRKGWLRLGGCLVGSLCGFLAIVYLIPQMETIVSLLLLVAVVSALAGWVAAGSERIAYAGLQMAFAFYLSVFQGFAPATDFDVLRDRVVGIILGIFAVSLVFRYIWPERVLARLRVTLGQALRGIASLLVRPRLHTPAELSQAETMRVRAEASGKLDESLRLVELASFEDEESAAGVGFSAGEIATVVARTRELYPGVAILSGEAASAEWERLPVEMQIRDNELRDAAAARLEGVAAAVEKGTNFHRVGFGQPLFTRDRTPNVPAATGYGRELLLQRIVSEVQALT